MNNLTGIAAILRFVLPQLDEMVEADEGDLDSDDESQAILGENQSEEEANEAEEEQKSGSSGKNQSDADSAFMDDVFN